MKVRYICNANLYCAFILVSSFAHSNPEITANIAAGLSGSEEQVNTLITPGLGLTYQTNALTFNTDWLATMSYNSAQWNADSWQVLNQLSWQSPSNLLAFGAAHSNQTRALDSSVVEVESASVDATVNIPVSETLIHGLFGGVTLESQRSELTNPISDTLVTIGYTFSWASSKSERWQANYSSIFYDSGASINQLNLNWAHAGNRMSIDAGLSGSQTAQNNNSTDVIGAEGSVSYEFERATASFGFSRSQTDALSFFSLVQLNEPITQQSQLLVTDITFAITGVRLLSNVTANGNYTYSETYELLNIADFSIDQAVASEFLSSQIEFIYLPTNRTTISANYQSQISTGTTSHIAQFVFGHSFNAHWTAEGQVSKEIVADDGVLSWAASLNYNF